MRPRALLWLGIPALLLLAQVGAQEAQAPAAQTRTGPVVTVLTIKGPIGPATSHYVEKGIEAAQSDGTRLIVLEMDTPGGLDTAMRDIIQAILGSSVPVATYVSPPGARAASAGTYILYASHIAAMAPATNLGAATPVAIGGEPAPTPGRPGEQPGGEPDSDAEKPDRTSGEDKPQADRPAGRKPARGDDRTREPATAMERKAVNDAVAYIRGLAELRGRNADWAEEAVRGAASLSYSAALEANVIDVVAQDLPDLLRQIDGRKIQVANRTVELDTDGLTVVRAEPDWRTELLSVITNPTIAYGLLLIGIYGLLFEGYNPGAIVPGVVGAIALITALFAFQILSVNYAGLALIALGIAMIVAEFFVPSFGALGLGGLVAFVVGSIILLDSDAPGMRIAMPLIGGVATVGGLVVIGIAWLANRSMRRPVVTGAQAMIGATAEVVRDFEGRGPVRYGGELWNAQSAVPLRAGQQVRITRVDGLLLWVEPL